MPTEPNDEDRERAEAYWKKRDYGMPIGALALEFAAVRAAEREAWAKVVQQETGYQAGFAAGSLALAACEARERASARYAAFGEWAFEQFWHDAEPGDIDGGDAQEAAIKHGLLRRREDGDRYATCGGEMGCGWKDGDPVEVCECLFPTTGPLSAPRDSGALKAFGERVVVETVRHLQDAWDDFSAEEHLAEMSNPKRTDRATIVARILSGGAA